jgi:hypothetical protein
MVCVRASSLQDPGRESRALSNPALAPHLSFVDMAGHGYATVRVTDEMFETDFVCIPRPIEWFDRPDGGPLRYRVRHRARLWTKGQLNRNFAGSSAIRRLPGTPPAYEGHGDRMAASPSQRG